MIEWLHESRSRLQQKHTRDRLKTCPIGKLPALPKTTASTATHKIPVEPTSDFRHEPLGTDRRHIRLVRIHIREPGLLTGLNNNNFECIISNHIADSAPPYIALSYTWGAPNPTRIIRINGKRFAVRENLYNFLNTFKSHEHVTSYLWIDQLCIDQTNVSERNHQVRLMTRLYRNCTFVITWLDQSAYSATQDLQSGKKQNLDRVAFKSLDRFLRNRYFTRLWIVQEVLLAPRVHIVCDDIWLSWNQIRRAIVALSDHRLERLPEAMWLFRMKQESDIENTSTRARGLRLSLAECVSLYSGLGCEDYRDKVYGLLGLVHGDSDRPELDYDKSLQVVYLDTVKILLAQDQLKYTLKYSTSTALHLSRSMGFSKQDLNALQNMFRDISELLTIDAIGLKSSACPTSHWWWYESMGERWYYYGNGRYLEMRETVGAGQNLSYNVSEAKSNGLFTD